MEPRIWRRFLIRKNCSFHELHDTIQRACGWLDYNLYEFRQWTGKEPFERGDGIASSPYDESWDVDEVIPNGCQVQLADHLPFGGQFKLAYEYDFGDSWLHLIELKGVQQLPGTSRRHLIGGERAFPPEDCGSITGYERCLQAFVMSETEIAELDDPAERSELEMTKQWLGDWHPQRFDFDAITNEFKQRVNWPW
ncbi:plasmid pRiA4b ORF-3 family protein [Phycisphaerales bacterium AB-hyl4]|uniref:Plasmid pRiA4b ORF-3 family protein n=1 Tax=Natronomicrosphaera hydrolytica TaxID=3242702 RepID=A0ABV4U2F7_9BACT